MNFGDTLIVAYLVVILMLSCIVLFSKPSFVDIVSIASGKTDEDTDAAGVFGTIRHINPDGSFLFHPASGARRNAVMRIAGIEWPERMRAAVIGALRSEAEGAEACVKVVGQDFRGVLIANVSVPRDSGLIDIADLLVRKGVAWKALPGYADVPVLQ